MPQLPQPYFSLPLLTVTLKGRLCKVGKEELGGPSDALIVDFAGNTSPVQCTHPKQALVPCSHPWTETGKQPHPPYINLGFIFLLPSLHYFSGAVEKTYRELHGAGEEGGRQELSPFPGRSLSPSMAVLQSLGTVLKCG